MKQLWVSVCAVLCGTEVPVWLKLAGISLGVVGTYFLLPYINQDFERQKIKTEFVLRTFDDLNLKSRSVVTDLSKVNRGWTQGRNSDQSSIDSILSKITELQWKALELSVIFEGSKSISIIEDYQIALDKLRLTLVTLKDDNSAVALIDSIETFATASVAVMREVSSLSGLNFSRRVPAVN